MRIATALLILSVLGCGDRASPEQILQLPPWEPSVRIVDGSRPTVEFRKTPVLDLRNVIEATLRVGPDRRVLLAVPVIDTLSGGNASDEVALDFRDGSWVVRYKGAEIGRLSYLSGFDEGIDFLTRYAASLPPRLGMQPSANTVSELENKVTEFSPEALVGALRTIDDQSLALRDPRISRVASRAFTFLQLQSIDRAGLGDPMSARILACLAIHRAAGTGDDAEERALAADLMGYERDARRIAETLPEAHSLRRFISDKEVPDQPRSPLSIYVQTLQRVRNARITDENEDLEVLVSSVLPLVSRSAARLVLEDTPFQSVMPSVLRAATIEELREISGIRKIGMSGLMEKIGHLFGSRGGVGVEIEELEDVLEKAESEFRGKLFDAGTLRTYIEQNFYSGVWEEGDNYLSALGSDGATKGFLESFGRQKRSRAAAEVRLWYDTARQLEYTRKDDKWLVERLPLFRKMSPHFRAVLLESLSTHNQGWHYDARTPAARLIGQLDSRPGELEDAAMLSRSFLSDQMRWERYRTAAFEAAASDRWFFYHQTGQYPKLLEYASDRTRDFAERGMAVLYLYKSGQLDESSARQRFDELLADPASGGFFRAYGLFLNETGDMVTKQKAVENWIENHPDAEGLTIAWHKYVLSNSLERQGKYKEAYAVIAPYLHYWSANVVLQTASVLQRIGKPDEAIVLGNQAIERYGDSVRDGVAPILWRERRYAEAAQMLNAEKYVISSEMTTETIPENFYRSFADQAPAERASAFSALAGSKAPVAGILEYYTKKKEYKTSFQLWSILLESRKDSLASGSGMDLSQTVKYVFDASKALEQTEGSHAAREWALSFIPAPYTNEAVVISHGEGADALTFDLSERPTPKPRVAMMMKAFAAARLKLAADDPRYLRLLQDVGAGPPDNFFFVVTRYLLTLSSADEMAERFGTKERGNPIVTYALAVRSLSEGDYEAGNDWLVATMLLSRDGDFAIVWAYSTANRWSHAYKSFQQIAKAGMV